MSQSVLAQKSYAYLKNIDEVKGKRTAFTEININASPEIVKKIFLEFEKNLLEASCKKKILYHFIFLFTNRTKKFLTRK